MYFLVYISTSVKLMSPSELASILESSIKNNSEHGLTGMLMYSQGTFIQSLEGDEDAVNDMYASIEKDARHKNMILLASGPISERVFPDWSMAFLTPDPDKMNQLEGYINPIKNKLFEEDDRETVISILRTFAENNNLTPSYQH